MAVYADSSLLLKLYHSEPESPLALSMAQQHAPALPYTALHRLEITSSLRRLVLMGRMTPLEAARALRLLRQNIFKNNTGTVKTSKKCPSMSFSLFRESV